MLIKNSPVTWKTAAPCLFNRYDASERYTECSKYRCFISCALKTVLICIHKQGQTKIMFCFYPSPILNIIACWSLNSYTMRTVKHKLHFPNMFCFCVLKQDETNIKLSLALPTYYLVFTICFQIKLPWSFIFTFYLFDICGMKISFVLFLKAFF